MVGIESLDYACSGLIDNHSPTGPPTQVRLTSNAVAKSLSIMPDNDISISLFRGKVEGRPVNVNISEVISHGRICKVGGDPVHPFSGRWRTLTISNVKLEAFSISIYIAAITTKVKYVGLSLLEFWRSRGTHVGDDFHVDIFHGDK